MTQRIGGTFENPDQVEEIGEVRAETLELDNMTIGRFVHPPGWRWSIHLRPIVGTENCQFRHLGFVISGTLAVSLTDGTTHELSAGSAYDIPPGHDSWVVGREPAVVLEWKGLRDWLQPRHGERILATLAFTDIVDSTVQARRLGDRAWRARLAQHDETVRQVLAETRGYEVKTTGDGFLARFGGPAQALDAATRIRERVGNLGLDVRQGIHVGEVELLGRDITGLAVHEAARILNEAGTGEILVSRIVRSLAESAGFSFESKGARTLKGIPGTRELFALIP
ncbi:MAG: adenylate/guanylate cyclase domain-containing protein [Candidatus Neomarinimicrobiota bacterium]